MRIERRTRRGGSVQTSESYNQSSQNFGGMCMSGEDGGGSTYLPGSLLFQLLSRSGLLRRSVDIYVEA